MSKPYRISNAVGVVAIFIVAMLAVLTFILFRSDVNILRSEQKIPITLITTSLENSLTEYDELLQDFSDTYSPETLTEIDQLLVKINSRVATLESNINMLEGADGNLDDAVSHMKKISNEMSIFVQGIKNDSIGNVRAHLSDMRIMTGEFSDVIHDIMHILIEDEYQQYIETQELSRSRSRSSLIISLFTVFTALLGMGYFIFLNSRNEILASNNDTLVKTTKTASAAKSRLLTMLSHEIRNPMNGVLGLISLVLQNKIPDSQRQLLERAQDTSSGMVSFLDDMLDFSNFADQSQEKDQILIITKLLFSSLEKRIREVANKYNVDVKFVLGENIPDVFIGDYQRIHQVFFYLFSYIIKHTPNRNFMAEFRYDEGQLVLKSDFYVDDDLDQDWDVKAIIDAADEHEYQITTDTLETTLSLGLMDALSGQIKLLNNDAKPDQYRLLIFIPVIGLEQDKLRVGIVGDEPWMKPGIEKYFNHTQLEWVEEGACDRAHIVFNRIGTEERKMIANLRRVAPKSLIVGIGSTFESNLYDCLIGTAELKYNAALLR